MTLRQRLRQIGVTAQLLREMPARHALLRDDAAALAVRLWRDRVPLTPAEQQLLFGELPPTDPGLILHVIEGLYLFSAPDEVLGPSETTAILYRAARQLPGDHLLDLGCGCGTLALLLGRPRTVATDISGRAIQLARDNAALNGIAGTDFRAGSLYQPVASERFDLIVSQPPYLPRPEREAANPYYHAGQRGDELARIVLHDALAHLTPHGTALVFSDWPLAPGERLRDRIPHDSAQVTVFASPPTDAACHYAPQARGIARVQQALVMLRHGSGYEEREVHPGGWGRIGIQ